MSDEVLNKKGDYPKSATCKATKEASDPEAVANAAAAAAAFDENTCVVCFKNVEIFSIGECDHPVCYECSTRMRVLCQQNECPICRQVLSKVIFTLDKLPYRELEAKNRSEYYSKKYQIGFYTSKIQQAFFNLLDHQCPKCNAPPYRTFNGLKNHVRKDHDLHYCDLCTEHLKIFTFERRCYTQTELGLHRVKGDVDNKSHRGHPLCEYCKCRYLDRDELFRHLRRDHYFCHFCDADGFNDFYRDYDALVEHFREDHYLCEEGKCATEQFTGAFRTEIDYKAHVANVHGKSLNKQQVKQARTLQLEITLGRRGGGRNGGQPEQGIANVRSRGNEDIHDELYEELMSQSHQRAKTIDAQNEQDFPSLGGASGGPAMSLARAAPLSMRNRTGTAGLARTKENFPALGGGCNTSIGQQQHQSADASGATNSNNQNANATGMVIRVSNRPASHNAASNNSKPKSNAFDFPALPAGAKSSSFSAGQQQQHQTNVMRKPGATGAIARTSNSSTNNNNNATGMVIHVSNRPPSHSAAGTNTKSKPTALDFPSLAIGGKSKKQAAAAANRQLLLEEDMLPSDTNISMNYVSAKHRTLVDDYVSVANPITFKKLQLVQREEQEAKAKKAAAEMHAPKLTAHEFPSLAGGGSSSSNSNNKTTNTSNTWSKSNTDKKQRELENRKSKIAPAPILTKANKTTTNSTTLTNNNEGLALAKKDKKVKDKKPATNGVMESLTSKSSNKMSREKNNNIENKSANANINNVNALASSVNDASNNMNVTRPPPGFVNTNTNGVNNNVMKPPPGFQSSVVVNSIAKSPNSLTFTSSLGESYSIVPTHAYIPPPESITRNQKLVEHFKESLNTPEAIDEFRHISQKFREGVYKTPAYYEHCQSALKDKFDKIFPELLALLPDINKQQALYLVHSQRLKNLTADQRKFLPHLAVCSTCKQVLLSSDLENHKKLHNLRENFPTLSSCAGKANTTTNRK